MLDNVSVYLNPDLFWPTFYDEVPRKVIRLAVSDCCVGSLARLTFRTPLGFVEVFG